MPATLDESVRVDFTLKDLLAAGQCLDVTSAAAPTFPNGLQLALSARGGGGGTGGGANASTAPVASVELASALHSCKPCKQCRGSQYFSFCLNRVVNADRVQHCNDCGRCFYFRPGFARGCPYCAADDDMDDEEKDWQALFGAAARGFWRSPTAPAGQQFFQAW